MNTILNHEDSNYILIGLTSDKLGNEHDSRLAELTRMVSRIEGVSVSPGIAVGTNPGDECVKRDK